MHFTSRKYPVRNLSSADYCWSSLESSEAYPNEAKMFRRVYTTLVNTKKSLSNLFPPGREFRSYEGFYYCNGDATSEGTRV